MGPSDGCYVPGATVGMHDRGGHWHPTRKEAPSAVLAREGEKLQRTFWAKTNSTKGIHKMDALYLTKHQRQGFPKSETTGFGHGVANDMWVNN